MKVSHQRGVVLVMTLMVLAVVATLSMYTLRHIDRSMSLVSYGQDSAATRQQLLGGEAWARAWLAAQKNNDVPAAVLDLDRPWHMLQQSFELEGTNSQLQINIINRQACIDVNLLGQADRALITEQRLVNLSSALSITSDWIVLVKDWLDSDQNLSSASSHEDEFYLGLEVPYRTGDTALVDATELSLMPIDLAVLQRLIPYICWLPEASQINVNRLSKPLIEAYFPSLTEQGKTALLARLASSGFASVTEFLVWAESFDLDVSPQDWRVDDRFVEAYITLESDGQSRYLHSRLSRQENGLVESFARAYGPFDVLSNTLLQSDSETGR